MIRLLIASLTGIMYLSACAHKPNAPHPTISLISKSLLLDGQPLGKAGAYEMLHYRIEGTIDVTNPVYGELSDVQSWRASEDGNAPYATEILILKPAIDRNSNGSVLFEWPNRGRSLSLRALNEAAPIRPQRQDEPSPHMAIVPTAEKELGNRFLFDQGYTLVLAGWESNTYRRDGLFAELPFKTLDNSSKVKEEFAVGFRSRADVTTQPLMFEAVPGPSLLRKRMTANASEAIAAHNFSITPNNELELLSDEGVSEVFERGIVYELEYPVQSYPYSGLGLAIMNDLGLGLKGKGPLAALANVSSTPGINPNVIAFGASQPGRALRTFIRKVPEAEGFDGFLILAAGAGQSLIDAPFSQTSKTATAFHDSFLPEFRLEEDLVLDRDGPKVMEVLTSSEYWQKVAFLTHARVDGTARTIDPAHRIYAIAGVQHTGGNGDRSTPGPCALPRNPTNPAPVMRALLVSLENWISRETPPPRSNFASFEARTLIPASRLNFSSLLDIEPPAPHRPSLVTEGEEEISIGEVLVARLDATGNESSGIRLPAIAAPLSTRSGWNFDPISPSVSRLCHQYGANIDLAATSPKSGDNRPALAEIFESELVYSEAVEAILNDLISEGYLLANEKTDLLVDSQRRYREAIKQ